MIRRVLDSTFATFRIAVVAAAYADAPLRPATGKMQSHSAEQAADGPQPQA